MSVTKAIKTVLEDSEKRVRKSPVPANFDRIKEGALKLPLKLKVDLKNALSSAIDNEVLLMQEEYNAARELLGK